MRLTRTYCALFVSWYSSIRTYLKPLPILVQHIRVLLKEAHRQTEKVVEIHRVVRFEFLLVVLVKAPDVSLPEVAGPLLIGDPVDELVLGGADAREHRAWLEVFRVHVELFQGLFARGELIRRIKDDEMALVPDAIGMPAQDLDAGGVKGADPQSVCERARRAAAGAPSSRLRPCW